MLTTTNEAETLRTLHNANVEHIPDVVCGGDIPGHSTINHTYLSKLWAAESLELPDRQGRKSGMIAQRLQTFLLIRDVGKSLSEFTSTKQLLQATFDAFTGE